MTTLAAGWAEGLDGPIEMSRWCPKCRELVLFNARTDKCSWCDSPTIPAAEAARKETHVSATATAVECKVDGCRNDAVATTGPYAKLCAEHKQQRKTATPTTGATGGLVDQVRALVPAARKLERARAKAAGIDAPEKARAELAEAMRRVEGAPTAENLSRLEKATRAMRDGQPSRDKARKQLEEAQQQFNYQLATVAKASKTA